ncbi:MAG: sulfite exporter TauE/SafE family protein [Deltaproteobacteria bacterium]|nr:sulfite exporter TauE/SafE family protein [Deltaproteobacteria bacterium]
MPTTDPQALLALSELSQLGLVFVAGIATSFTPCVYPLIPITLTIFGAREQKSKLQAFILSLIYVLGIATTYTTLGLVSALTGSFFGSFLSSPFVSVVLFLIFLLFAFASLDIFHFQLSQSLQSKANTVGGKGYLGSFTMGLVSGIVAAPCTGPVLATILLVSSTIGNPYWGSILLFVHALGLGLLFIVLGTFSGLLSKIPKSGNWLHLVKFFMGAVIIVLAFFFVKPFTNYLGLELAKYTPIFFVATTVILSSLLGFISMRQDAKPLKVLSVLLLGLALFAVPTALSFQKQEYSEVTAPHDGLNWLSSIDEAKAVAKADSIIFVDFFADWCAACLEYNKITFKDPAVIEQLEKLILVKLDFTSPSDELETIQERYEILGLPSLLFLDNQGNEIPNTRVTGFLEPKEFLVAVNKATQEH